MDGSLPVGRHELTVQAGRRTGAATILSAPRRVRAADGPPEWGAFLPLHALSADLGAPAHSPTEKEMRALFETAGFTVAEQHRVRRPVWTPISDVITVGVKPA